MRLSPLARFSGAVLLVASPTLAQVVTDAPEEPEAPAPPTAATPAGVPAWRELGPTIFGGRIVDLAIHPDHPANIWVASASGGLWLTENHGTTWRNLFDDQPVVSIGDIAVDPRDANVLWVGTGEANNQRSSYWGDGVYKSTDGGETWTNVGLPDSHHVGRIVIDPVDSNKVFVAALGHLYTPNEERGLYRTLDGGESWERVLHVNEDVGVVDVAVDPSDSRYVYAASYERRRRAWDFDGNGPGSGIWRSTNGGATFERCEGLPTGDIARIGLDVYAKDPKVVFATISDQNRVEIEREPEKGLVTEFKENQLVVQEVGEGSGAASLGLAANDVLVAYGGEALGNALSWLAVVERHAALEEDSEDPAATLVVKRGEETLEFEASLRQLFSVREREPETREVGSFVWRSDDHGETWTKVTERSTGINPPYYYGQIRVDPTNSDNIFLCNVPLLRSRDGGKSFERIAGSVHVDHHSLIVHPEDPNKIYLGNDGGLHISYDGGDTWTHVNNIPMAQFYAVGVDHDVPFRVFGGTQDNGTWGGPHTSRDSAGIHPVEWFYVGGGDGFYTVVDPRDLNTVYGESQFGAIYRRDLEKGTSARIRPRIEGERLRFNWNSPIVISNHNPEIIYFGGNRLFKSFNRGDSWPIHSPDLTTNDAAKIAGNVPHCTITTVSESPLDPGLVLVGTDDGNVQLTRDGCYTWTNLTGNFPGAPANWWVSRAELSRHDAQRAYVSFTGYREDDFRPLLFRTDELGSGRAWRNISAGLPAGEPVNVVREDPTNPDVLYAGTELGAYVSWDGGETWQGLGQGLPTVAVHDLAVQGRDGVVVAATHGRGFWAVDVNAMRGMQADAAAKPATLLPVNDVVRLARRRAVGGYGGGDQTWRGTNARSVAHVVVHLGEDLAADAEASLYVEDDRGEVLANFDMPRTAGSHAIDWDLRADPRGEASARRGARGRTVANGEYTVVLTVGGSTQRQSFEVSADPLLSDR